MNRVQAMLIQEGSRLVGVLIRNRDLFRRQPQAEVEVGEDSREWDEEQVGTSVPISEKSTAIPTGCIPCSIGHLGTCTGLLNEAMRFARDNGIQSEEVIGRVNMCLDELNALERVDLRPEMIHGLPDWEKPLAEKALSLSRQLRHDLEGVSDVSTLETISANTQSVRQDIGQSWFRERLSRMTPDQRAQVEEKLKERAAEREKQEE